MGMRMFEFFNPQIERFTFTKLWLLFVKKYQSIKQNVTLRLFMCIFLSFSLNFTLRTNVNLQNFISLNVKPASLCSFNLDSTVKREGRTQYFFCIFSCKYIQFVFNLLFHTLIVECVVTWSCFSEVKCVFLTFIVKRPCRDFFYQFIYMYYVFIPK